MTAHDLDVIAGPVRPSPLVSIVTPTLQRRVLLERTLRSVQSQTYQPIEHIVVDGGSTDGTVELLAEYAKSYNLRWVSEPDRGMYDAINKGMRMARGEILAYLNSDDAYLPWAVEVAVSRLTRKRSAAVVYGDLIRIDELHGGVIPLFAVPFSSRWTPWFGSLMQPSTFWRREVFETLGGFDIDLRFVADADFWFRAGNRFEFDRVSEFLAIDLLHEAAFTVAQRDAMALEDARMRAGHRRTHDGPPGTATIARVRWHLRSAMIWARFVAACWGRGGGWSKTNAAFRPKVDGLTALVGLLPSKGSRRRARLGWAIRPDGMLDR